MKAHVETSVSQHLESEMVVRAGRGDKDAMTILYHTHAKRLTELGYSILRSRTEAEDVVHNVFVNLAERAHQYRPELGSVGTWLASSMRNACLDRRRRHASSARLRSSLARTADAQWRPDETHVARAIDGQRVVQALDGLPETLRQTMTELYRDDLSCADVARKSGVPIGTIKSRAARGLAALRASLRETAGLPSASVPAA